MKLHEEASILYEGLLAEGHDRYAVRACAGWAYEELGRLEEAEAHYTRAVELRPIEPVAAENLARVRERLGRE